MKPSDFLREMCQRSHNPGLKLHDGMVLFSDQAQVCSIVHFHHSGIPCVQLVSDSPCIDIGPLPLAVTMLDGTSGTAVVVSRAAAEKLLQAAGLIFHFQE